MQEAGGSCSEIHFGWSIRQVDFSPEADVMKKPDQ